MVRVIEVLRGLDNRLPVRIQTDNASQSISKSLEKLAQGAELRRTSPAPENQRITRLLNHSTAIWVMNTRTCTGHIT